MCSNGDDELLERVGLGQDEDISSSLAKQPASKKKAPKKAHSTSNQVTKSSKIKFISYAGSSSAAKKGRGGAAHADNDAAPENETQVERKRRLNRMNERKKRARKVVKIETLTLTFHNLTNSNETIREENEKLREQIELVKNHMSKSGSRLGERASNMASIPTSMDHRHCISITSSTFLSRNTSSPSIETEDSVLSSSSRPDIDNLSREQKMLLLQSELERQQRLRLQIQLLSGSHPGAAPSPNPAIGWSSSSQLASALSSAQPSLSWISGSAPSSAAVNRSAWPSPSSSSLTTYNSLGDAANRAATNPLSENALAQQQLHDALRRLGETTFSRPTFNNPKL